MLIERTIHQLRRHSTSPERAKELGQLGYMQWLGGLPGSADYRHEATRAYLTALPFKDANPAVAEFCELLRHSVRNPLQPLDLMLPRPCRRGGARRRRLSL